MASEIVFLIWLILFTIGLNNLLKTAIKRICPPREKFPLEAFLVWLAISAVMVDSLLKEAIKRNSPPRKRLS